MWDNHRLLNGIANALFGLSLLLAIWGGLKLLVESPLFLLKSIRIEGELRHVGRAEVVNALQGRIAGTFFNMDLEAVRVLFETIPWVRRAEVRRQWPDRLEVRMEEHVPLARWGQPEERRMVNNHGEVFSAPYGALEMALPQFAGPAGTAREVSRRYAAFSGILEPLQLQPSSVVLSPRYSWQIRLSNGLAVQLGRESDKDGIEARLARFVGAYPVALAPLARGRRLDYVDLRYSNGFALRVPGIKDASVTPAKPAATSPQTRPQKRPQQSPQERKQSA